jgi:ATP-dependent RNA helicase DeaD
MNQDFNAYNLSADIMRALKNLGYTKPTEVQEKVIPRLLNQSDLIIQAQTGSGKTASFAIPLCEKIDWTENRPQVLVLTPTRELAQQVAEDFTNIGRYKRVKATPIYGKSSFVKQKQALKQKSHVVVGTPGRVLDHLEKGTFPIDKIDYLIIDEADEMLKMGFIDQVASIIEELPSKRVTSIFSATLPTEIVKLANKYMKQPTEIKIAVEGGVIAENITHQIIDVNQNNKFDQLFDVLITENPDSCMIFCRTQVGVDQLTDQLDRKDLPCDKIHGGMLQEDRFDVMADFKKGVFRYFIATDVAARGIDVDNVPLVLNYDIPLEKESYVHRIGRTGRAGRSGKAITFVTPNETNYLAEIETYIGAPIEKVDPPQTAAVEANRAAFEEKIATKQKAKKDPSAKLNREITKLYFNGGKKEKDSCRGFCWYDYQCRGSQCR